MAPDPVPASVHARARRVAIGAFFAFGVAVGIVGPTLPGLSRDLGLGSTATGLLVAVEGGCFGLGVIAAGVLSDRIGRRTPLVGGCAGLAVALAVVASAPTAWVAFAGLGLAGLASGGIDTGGGGLTVDSAEGRPGRALLLVNVGFGVGALLAPALVGAVIWLGGDWRLALLLASVLCLAMALPVLRVPARTAIHDHRDRHGIWRLMRDRRFLALMALTCFYLPAEFGLSNWFSTYAVDARGFSEALGAACVSAFWGAITLGRLAMSRSHLAERPAAVLPAACGAAGLCVALILVTPTVGGAVGLLFAAGLAVSVIFPLCAAAATALYPADAGAALGLILGSSGLAEVALPLIMGRASSAAGTPAAGLVTVAAAFGVCVVAALVFRSLSAQPAPAPAHA
jgi:FHS family glucose/mannose:H+ symporter-like MFS transporter